MLKRGCVPVLSSLLKFMKPSKLYLGSFVLSGTGMKFPFSLTFWPLIDAVSPFESPAQSLQVLLQVYHAFTKNLKQRYLVCQSKSYKESSLFFGLWIAVLCLNSSSTAPLLSSMCGLVPNLTNARSKQFSLLWRCPIIFRQDQYSLSMLQELLLRTFDNQFFRSTSSFVLGKKKDVSSAFSLQAT